MPKLKFISIFFLLLVLTHLANAIEGAPTLYLRNNLKKAHTGDFIVTAQNKNYTLLHVYSRNNRQITLEEITVPIKKYSNPQGSWKSWVKQKAPGHTSWILFSLDLDSGKMTEIYSVTKGRWFNTQEADSFLGTLLNLPFKLIPLDQRKKVGFNIIPGMMDKRPLWQPKLVFEGDDITGIWFDAWKAKWPKDGSELAEKTIEVFIPQGSDKYPSYFPYWLQISGTIAKAKIRIIDSGNQMSSPVAPIEPHRP